MIMHIILITLLMMMMVESVFGTGCPEGFITCQDINRRINGCCGCLAGKYANHDTSAPECYLCAVGKNSAGNQDSCIKCEAGTCSGKGSSLCFNCQPTPQPSGQPSSQPSMPSGNQHRSHHHSHQDNPRTRLAHNRQVSHR